MEVAQEKVKRKKKRPKKEDLRVRIIRQMKTRKIKQNGGQGRYPVVVKKVVKKDKRTDKGKKKTKNISNIKNLNRGVGNGTKG